MKDTTTPADRIGLLISALGRMGRSRFEARVRDLGLTRPQWRALNGIRYEPGINQRGLATRLEVEQMTIARQIELLEAKGWIERRIDPADRRNRRLFLTEAMMPFLEKIDMISSDLHDELYEGFSEDEVIALEASLRKLHTRMAELLNEPDTIDRRDEFAEELAVLEKARLRKG
jgi:DNA-binding MarR family transcriptional regulator